MDLFNTNEELEIHPFNLQDADVTLYKNFFTTVESNKLFKSLQETIEWKQETAKLFDKEFDIPRLTALYGDPEKTYTYSGILLNPIKWTDDLLFIKERVEKTTGDNFSSVLLNLYRSGNDCVHWHSDDKPELGPNPTIASVSFGQSRTFQLKHKLDPEIERTSIELDNGCMLLMKGTTQSFWLHQVPKSKTKMQPRINLTFRTISKI